MRVTLSAAESALDDLDKKIKYLVEFIYELTMTVGVNNLI